VEVNLFKCSCAPLERAAEVCGWCRKGVAILPCKRGFSNGICRIGDVALLPVKVALFERQGGSILPCNWLRWSGICMKMQKMSKKLNLDEIFYYKKQLYIMTVDIYLLIMFIN
jgi:hypothetical protein